VQQGQLNRWRDNISNEYLYYTDRKPKEVLHMLLRSETYIKLTKDNKLCDFVPEYEFGNIKADAYFEIWKNGYTLPYFLEVQLSSNFRQEKYEKEYNNGAWIEHWEEFPTVLVVSDNRIHYKSSNVKFVQLGQKSPIKL
jgi:MoaA/NifB/PqqE/SkfB family radical SAM enzyme